MKLGEVHQGDSNEVLGGVDTRDTVSNSWKLSLLNLPIALGVGGLHLTIVIPALQETPSAASILSADTFKMSVVQQLRSPRNYSL